jgi:thioredoxin-like negative regulator of GroEL
VTARSDGNCQPVDVTVENFDEIVMRRDGRPVLVGFWAPGCRPSAAVSAILASLAADFSDAAVIARVNVEQDDALADAARVDVVPTLHLIWQGRPGRCDSGGLHRTAAARPVAVARDEEVKGRKANGWLDSPDILRRLSAAAAMDPTEARHLDMHARRVFRKEESPPEQARAGLADRSPRQGRGCFC